MSTSRVRPCPTTKVPYATWGDAEKAFGRLRHDGQYQLKRRYRCPWCNQIHLTSQPGRGPRDA